MACSRHQEKLSITTCTQQLGDRFIVVEHVPAWVCEQCGETYYDPDVVEQIQTLIGSGAEPVRTIEASVDDLNAI